MDTFKKDLFSIVKKIELLNEKSTFQENLHQHKKDIKEICEKIPNARYYYLNSVILWSNLNSLVEINVFEKLLNCLYNEFTFHCIVNLKTLDIDIVQTNIFFQAAQIISKIENRIIKISYYDFILNFP